MASLDEKPPEKVLVLMLTLSLICLSRRNVGVFVFLACYHTFLREERRHIERRRGHGSDGKRTTTIASG